MRNLLLCNQCYEELKEEEAELWAFLCRNYLISKQKCVSSIDCVEISTLEKKGYIISTECNHKERILIKVNGFTLKNKDAQVCCKADLHGTY